MDGLTNIIDKINEQNDADCTLIIESAEEKAKKILEDAEITLKKSEKDIKVKVEDTGEGMSKETGQHIFDKFYQGDTSRFKEGNGLGLALVQKIAERNGYEITIESEVNKGTEFIVKIKK